LGKGLESRHLKEAKGSEVSKLAQRNVTFWLLINKNKKKIPDCQTFKYFPLHGDLTNTFEKSRSALEVSEFILYLGQITQTPTVTVGQVQTEGNVSLTVTAQLHSGHQDAL
jgi:hypothetical protein